MSTSLEYRVFSLDDPAKMDAALSEVAVVLHCAGPFSRTSKPMADACLRTKTHYLDITGEATVIETLAARDREAKDAGVMLLPCVGFDVVPSDCLAAHLKRRLAFGDASCAGHSGHGTRLARDGDDDGREHQSRRTRQARWRVDPCSRRMEDS